MVGVYNWYQRNIYCRWKIIPKYYIYICIYTKNNNGAFHAWKYSELDISIESINTKEFFLWKVCEPFMCCMYLLVVVTPFKAFIEASKGSKTFVWLFIILFLPFCTLCLVEKLLFLMVNNNQNETIAPNGINFNFQGFLPFFLSKLKRVCYEIYISDLNA